MNWFQYDMDFRHERVKKMNFKRLSNKIHASISQLKTSSSEFLTL